MRSYYREDSLKLGSDEVTSVHLLSNICMSVSLDEAKSFLESR